MARGEGRKDRASGTFGSVDKLATGYRARYFGPDGRRHKAPTLFLTKRDARSWLSLRQAEIIAKAWMPPGSEDEPKQKLTFADYAKMWLATRQVGGRPLKERTVEHYQKLLDEHLTDTFGYLPIASITPDDVRDWYAKTLTSKPTMRSHAYGLLRTILATAASDGKISTNPCLIRGAGTAKRVHKVRPATVDEIATIAAEMPEQWSLMVLFAAWLAMRFGELTELRRRDVDIGDEVVRIRHAVVRTKDGFKVTTPKSEAGVRDVAIARPHDYIATATLYRRFYTARAKAKRTDLRWHDLRHSGAVLAAATGATLAELMARLGHSTPAAAMRYQHAAQGRDREIAALLSKIAANGGV